MSSLTLEFRHITIVHSNDGEAWCNYILKQFQQPALKLRLQTLNLDTLPFENPPELLVSLQESYVTFVLMTAGMTDYFEAHSNWMSDMFYPYDTEVNTIMAVPCHVGIDDIIDVCCSGNYSFACWDFTEINIDGSNLSQIVEKALTWVDRNKSNRNAKLCNDVELLFSNSFCNVYPSTIQIGEKLAVVFTSHIEGDVSMIINGQDIILERINPYCAVCTVPSIPFGTHTATVLLEGEIKAKFNLEHAPFIPNSLDALMEAFGVQKKEDLDKLFAEKFSQSICSDPLLKKIEETLIESTERKIDTRFPSLIHWAAANGLKELCSQMLMSTAVISSCNILNRDNENAADLAGANDHLELEEYINDLLEAQLYVDACSQYVQEQSLYEGDIYEHMTPPKMSVAPPIPAKTTPSRFRRSSTNDIPPPTKPTVRKRIGSDGTPPLQPQVPFPNLKAFEKIQISDAAVGCRSQNELIDILDDFKRGNFSLGEVEMLFQSWKQRYNAGKAISFRDKQRLLEDFRTKNQRIFGLKKKKKMSKLVIKEEDTQLSISEPIIPRKPTIGLSSKRTKYARGNDTISASSSVSSDSGVGSAHIDVEEATEEPVFPQIQVINSSSKRDFSLIDKPGRSQPGQEPTYLSMSLRHKHDDNKTEFMPKRKSCLEMYKELEKKGEDTENVKPPPLPPRPRKTKFYSKSSKSKR